MNFILSLIITLVIVHLLVVIPLVGILAANLQFLFGVILPYAAVLIFLIGMIWRVTDLGQVPGSFPDPHHGRAAKITALDQGQ